jgi:hypothetical protein
MVELRYGRASVTSVRTRSSMLVEQNRHKFLLKTLVCYISIFLDVRGNSSEQIPKG